MFPIRDAIRSENFPIINTPIIIVNVVAVGWKLLQGSVCERPFSPLGLFPPDLFAERHDQDRRSFWGFSHITSAKPGLIRTGLFY